MSVNTQDNESKFVEAKMECVYLKTTIQSPTCYSQIIFVQCECFLNCVNQSFISTTNTKLKLVSYNLIIKADVTRRKITFQNFM